MISSQHKKLFVAAWVATSLLVTASPGNSARAQGNEASDETTSMTVVVKESDTGQPVSQAHITLQFWAPGGASRFGRPEKIVYNAKTDTQGRCKFLSINKGNIVLTITAPGRQSYGKELRLEKNNQVFLVKLKKPQPLV